MARKLTQREFYRHLVVSLCYSNRVRPAATQHHVDNTLERHSGHHYPERGKKRRDCACAAVVAQERRGTSQTQFLARAQAALLFAFIHASWLTIRKHFLITAH